MPDPAPFPIRIARVYDPPGPGDGARLLVDRLWPRGVAKTALPLDGWPKAAAPAPELRAWFHADPIARWPEFRRRYLAQLAADPAALAECLDWCRKGPVTLLSATRDRAHDHALVLRDHLDALLAPPAPGVMRSAPPGSR